MEDHKAMAYQDKTYLLIQEKLNQKIKISLIVISIKSFYKWNIINLLILAAGLKKLHEHSHMCAERFRRSQKDINDEW